MKMACNIILISAFSLIIGCQNGEPPFTEKILDNQAPEHLWMKTIGDINGDNLDE